MYPDGATPLSPEEMEDLKIGHISTRAELNRFEQDNIAEALSWLKKRRGSDILSEKFIMSLHKKMLGKVWRWAGAFRRSDKNIGVHWVQIPAELRKLLDDAGYWIEQGTYAPDEIAVRFHHKLVWIHLFANGNGRHARLMTDILLEELLGRKPFTWGSGQAGNIDDIRDSYLAALRMADRHDFTRLLEFVRS